MYETEQLNALDEMMKLVSNMFFVNKKGNLFRKPFQSGIIVSIKLIKALFNELKEEGIEYFLTTRANQDCIENFFSCVRAMGGNNSHPSPVETVSRIRKACVSKNVNFVIDCSNTHQAEQVVNVKCSQDLCFN